MEYSEMSVQQLADIRALGKERVEVVTDALRDRVIESHDGGVNIRQLAREAGVTSTTIYSWVKP